MPDLNDAPTETTTRRRGAARRTRRNFAAELSELQFAVRAAVRVLRGTGGDDAALRNEIAADLLDPTDTKE